MNEERIGPFGSNKLEHKKLLQFSVKVLVPALSLVF